MIFVNLNSRLRGYYPSQGFTGIRALIGVDRWNFEQLTKLDILIKQRFEPSSHFQSKSMNAKKKGFIRLTKSNNQDLDDMDEGDVVMLDGVANADVTNDGAQVVHLRTNTVTKARHEASSQVINMLNPQTESQCIQFAVRMKACMFRNGS